MSDYRGIPVDARPITRIRGGDGGTVLASRRVIGHLLGRNPELVSRYCTPVACDVANRALLYDADQVSAALATRQRRARRQCPNSQLSAQSA